MTVHDLDVEDLMPTDQFAVITDTGEFPAVKEEKQRPRHRRLNTRTSALYVLIVACWVALSAVTMPSFISVIQAGFRQNTAIGVTAVITTIFVEYFWLNGIKDVLYPFAFRLTPWREQEVPPRSSTTMPLVGLIYVTCNDFSASALTASVRQDYGNCEVVICDDSSKPEYKAMVNTYAAEHRVQVVRRPDNIGFKAGNLNHFLGTEDGKRYEYFVIVDSDEILPHYFVTRALDYFSDPEIGILQANHVATRNRTSFMRMFAPGVDAHWPAYQLVKSHAGFLSLLGHGAMISRKCYDAVPGGFPMIVAEDIGFAIDARTSGYRTEFAPDITCEEEFPIDYAAFKTRHRKWTEGNMEFMRHYTRRIFFSPLLKWYERLDIVLFTYSLPLTGLFSLYVLANAVVFPLAGFRPALPIWMLVPTVVFLLAPMLNDVLTWRKAPTGKLVSYLLHSVALFGSMFFVSLFASIRTMFKGSVFHVTPKTQAADRSVWHAVRFNLHEIIAALILLGVVSVAAGSALPVILIVIPVIFAPYLSVMNANDGTPDELGMHNLQKEEK